MGLSNCVAEFRSLADGAKEMRLASSREKQDEKLGADENAGFSGQIVSPWLLLARWNHALGLPITDQVHHCAYDYEHQAGDQAV